MNKRFFIFIFLNLVCALAAVRSPAQEVSDTKANSGVELFIAGKHYDSVQSYKVDRFRMLLKQIFPEQYNEDLNIFFDNILKDIPSQNLAVFTEADLRDIFEQFQGRIFQEQASQNVQFSEMKTLLEEFRKNHPSVSSLSLDVQKIKTLVISSQE